MSFKNKIWLKAVKKILEQDLGSEVEIKLEYRFHVKRVWRIDMAVFGAGKKIAVEIEGGLWTGGRHMIGKGYLNDIEKYNSISKEGYLLLRYTHTNHGNMDVVNDVKQIILQ